MYTHGALKADLLERSLSDLIQFAEIEAAARFDHGMASLPERREAILAAVMELVSEARIEVGAPVDIGNFLEFHAWPEEGEALRRRIHNTMEMLPDPGLGEGFWITRTEREAARHQSVGEPTN